MAGHRPIRSYVLRQGRLTPAQQRACVELLPRFGIGYAPAPLDLDAVFGRAAPRVVEIGCGMGETTIEIAAAHPHIDYIAIEVHTPGVGSLLRRIEARGLANVRIVPHDAVEVLEHMIAPAALHAVHIFFPDPWPKKRHHKRRLLKAPLVHLVATRLMPGGYVHAATDWRDYAEEILAVMTAEPALENTAAGFSARPAHRPLTKFEQRGLRLGHGVWDIVFRRRAGEAKPAARE